MAGDEPGPPEDDRREEIKVLKELEASAKDKARQGITVSIFDAPRGYQSAQEQWICETLAMALRDQGMADLCGIVSNADPNEFPDCRARCDDAPIAIEVTELIDACRQWSEWPLARFEAHLRRRISDKDLTAHKAQQDGRLAEFEALWLVIATDEALLTQALLAAYLDHVRVPRSRYFDQVFVLKGYEPGINAAVQGREHEQQEHGVGYTAFTVQWSEGHP